MITVFYVCVSLLALVASAAIVLLMKGKTSGIREVIDLARENRDLQRDLENIWLLLHEAKKGKTHVWLAGNNTVTDAIARCLYEKIELLKDDQDVIQKEGKDS